MQGVESALGSLVRRRREAREGGDQKSGESGPVRGMLSIDLGVGGFS